MRLPLCRHLLCRHGPTNQVPVAGIALAADQAPHAAALLAAARLQLLLLLLLLLSPGIRPYARC
jgi:hypothetical protein